MKTALAMLVISASALAQPAIAPPQIGFVLDAVQSLRPAYGIAGNFALGPPVAEHVISAAFDGSLGLLKTASSLTACDARGNLLASIHAAPGPAVFAFSPNGALALAYIASSNALIEWRNPDFLTLLLSPEETITDEVLAIAFPTPSLVTLIVHRGGQLWQIHLPVGKVRAVTQQALPGVRAPVLALSSGDLIYGSDSGIVIRKPDASEVHLAGTLPAHFSLAQIHGDWVQLTDLDSPARFAIHPLPGHEAIYQLPESGE